MVVIGDVVVAILTIDILNKFGTELLLTLLFVSIKVLKEHHIVAERALTSQSVVFFNIDVIC